MTRDGGDTLTHTGDEGSDSITSDGHLGASTETLTHVFKCVFIPGSVGFFREDR